MSRNREFLVGYERWSYQLVYLQSNENVVKVREAIIHEIVDGNKATKPTIGNITELDFKEEDQFDPIHEDSILFELLNAQNITPTSKSTTEIKNSQSSVSPTDEATPDWRDEDLLNVTYEP